MTEARALGLEVIDRCNLTVLQEPGQETLVEFLAQHRVRFQRPTAPLSPHSSEMLTLLLHLKQRFPTTLPVALHEGEGLVLTW